MYLNEINSVYNTSALYEHLEQDFFESAQTSYILNELDVSNLKQLVAKGKNLVSKAKGKVDDASRQLYVNAVNKFQNAGGDSKVVQAVTNHMKKYGKGYIVGAAILAALVGGIGDASAADMIDQADSAMQAMASADTQLSPKLVNALTDQMDGIFKASTEGGMKMLSGDEAVRTAAQAHGVSSDEMIQHLMKNVSTKEQLVGEFKKWVGAGIKKKLGMTI